MILKCGPYFPMQLTALDIAHTIEHRFIYLPHPNELHNLAANVYELLCQWTRSIILLGSELVCFVVKGHKQKCDIFSRATLFAQQGLFATVTVKMNKLPIKELLYAELPNRIAGSANVGTGHK
jgi:hypothetical protein